MMLESCENMVAAIQCFDKDMNQVSRQSNFELLRIIAMLFVLIVHADFLAIGEPSIADIKNNVLDSSIRVILQAIAISGVNIFVLISGWFGINPTIKSCCKLIFQCLFFVMLFHLIGVVFKLEKFSFSVVLDCLFLTERYWFIKSYFLLFLLSPVINTFLNNSERKQQAIVIVCFFAFQTIYGWVCPESTAFFRGGYSTISFIGLYMLANYLHKFQPVWTKFNKRVYAIIGLIIPFCIAVIYIMPTRLLNVNTTIFALKCISVSYIAPTTIVTSLAIFLLFTKFCFNSKIVNSIGGSSLAVYLSHAHAVVFPLFINSIKYLHNNCGYMFWLFLPISLLAVFIVSVLIDKVRLITWKKLSAISK